MPLWTHQLLFFIPSCWRDLYFSLLFHHLIINIQSPIFKIVLSVFFFFFGCGAFALVICMCVCVCAAVSMCVCSVFIPHGRAAVEARPHPCLCSQKNTSWPLLLKPHTWGVPPLDHLPSAEQLMNLPDRESYVRGATGSRARVSNKTFDHIIMGWREGTLISDTHTMKPSGYEYVLCLSFPSQNSHRVDTHHSNVDPCLQGEIK